MPAAFVAEQRTTVSPSGNTEPDAGTHVTGTAPSTGSIADTVNVTTAPDGPVASSTTLRGAVIVGGVSWNTASANGLSDVTRAQMVLRREVRRQRIRRGDRPIDERAALVVHDAQVRERDRIGDRRRPQAHA